MAILLHSASEALAVPLHRLLVPGLVDPSSSAAKAQQIANLTGPAAPNTIRLCDANGVAPANLATFHILAKGVDIGETLLEWADESMGVYGGRFMPNDRYAEVKPVIKLYAEAVARGDGKALDHAKFEEYTRQVSALSLTLVRPDGQPVAATQVTITDLIEEINEAEVEVFIDSPGLLDRYRGGRRAF